MKIRLISAVILLICKTGLFSNENSPISWDRNIDWERNKIEIEIKSSLNISDSTLSSTRLKAENRIHDNFTNIFFKNILTIPINSLESISSVINRKPEVYFLLDKLGESLTPEYSRLSLNLESLDSKYSFSIYPDLISVFYTQSQHTRVLKKLDHIEY